MEKEKTAQPSKKFIISIISLSFSMLIMMGALIGIWTITNNATSGNFAVSYAVEKATSIKVSSYYQYEGENNLSKFGELSFYADGRSEGAIEYVDINLTPQTSAVRLIYVFENSSEENIKIFPFWNELNYETNSIQEDSNNQNIYLNCQHFDALGNIDNDFLKNPTISLAPSHSKTSFILNEDCSTKVVVFTLSVANVNKNAYCRSSEEGGLSFYIGAIEEF